MGEFSRIICFGGGFNCTRTGSPCLRHLLGVCLVEHDYFRTTDASKFEIVLVDSDLLVFLRYLRL